MRMMFSPSSFAVADRRGVRLTPGRADRSCCTSLSPPTNLPNRIMSRSPKHTSFSSAVDIAGDRKLPAKNPLFSLNTADSTKRQRKEFAGSSLALRRGQAARAGRWPCSQKDSAGTQKRADTPLSAEDGHSRRRRFKTVIPAARNCGLRGSGIQEETGPGRVSCVSEGSAALRGVHTRPLRRRLCARGNHRRSSPRA